jgi:hypothetical protein
MRIYSAPTTRPWIRPTPIIARNATARTAPGLPRHGDAGVRSNAARQFRQSSAADIALVVSAAADAFPISSATPEHPINGYIAPNTDGTFYAGGTGSGSTGVSLVGIGGDITELSTTSMTGAWNVTAGLLGAGTGAIKMLAGNVVQSISVGFDPNWYFDDVDGKTIGVGEIHGGGGFALYDFTTSTEHDFLASGAGEAYAFDNGDGQYFVWQDDYAYLIDKSAWTVTAGPVATNATLASRSGQSSPRCAPTPASRTATRRS